MPPLAWRVQRPLSNEVVPPLRQEGTGEGAPPGPPIVVPKKMFKRKYHHCGPFNSVNNFKSDSEIDEICRQHDIGYGEYGPAAYFLSNVHDDNFIEDMEKHPGWWPWSMATFFKIKKKFMPPYGKRYRNNDGDELVGHDSEWRPVYKKQNTRVVDRPRPVLTIDPPAVDSSGPGPMSVDVYSPPPHSSESAGILASWQNNMNAGFTGGFGKTRKVRRGKLLPSMVRSMTQTSTTGTGLTEANCMYFNMCSVNRTMFRRDILASIVRSLWWREMVSISNFADAPGGTQWASCIYRLTYTLKEDGSESSTNTTSILETANWENHVAAIQTVLNTLTSGAGTNDYQLMKIQLIITETTGLVTEHVLHCDKSYFHYEQLHICRVQNISGANNDLSNRAAIVPIIGKQYHGWGFAPIPAAADVVPVLLNLVPPENGIIKIAGAGTVVAFRQPPPHTMFSNVKSSGGHFKWGNGDIKTMKSVFKKVFAIRNLIDLMMVTRTDNGDFTWGSFKMLSFEKAIGGTVTDNVDVRYETDSYGSGYVTGGRAPFVAVPTVALV